MPARDIKAIIVTSIYLLVYTIQIQATSALIIPLLMWTISPILVCWMVYTVLKYGKYTGPELGENEFGYADKKNSDLGVF